MKTAQGVIIQLMKRKRILKVLIAVIVAAVMLPIGAYYIIGPRDLTDGGEIYAQQVYYMFNTYQCVGWTMGGNNDIEPGRLLRYGLFTRYYKGKNAPDYIVVYEPHEKFVYRLVEKEDGEK